MALPSKPSWLQILEIEESDVRDVCRRILSIYARPKPDQLRLEQVIRGLKAELDQQRLLQQQQQQQPQISSVISQGGKPGASAPDAGKE